MKLKITALMLLAASFMGCAEVDSVKEGVKNAPSDFWTGLHTVLAYVLDLVSGVALGWVKGFLGL